MSIIIDIFKEQQIQVELTVPIKPCTNNWIQIVLYRSNILQQNFTILISYFIFLETQTDPGRETQHFSFLFYCYYVLLYFIKHNVMTSVLLKELLNNFIYVYVYTVEIKFE